MGRAADGAFAGSSPTKAPFEQALAALRRKERTTAELTAWLSERDFTADEVQSTIGELVELGELDDERFARRFAEDKRELSGWGSERIREALVGRGVESSVVEAALSGDSAGAEIDRAVDLLSKRAEALDDDSSRGRALAYLTRRGYEYEIAYEAIRLGERRAA